MHSFKRSSPHRSLFSSCIRRRHLMSAASFKLRQEIKDFEEALALQLEALKPKDGGDKKVLQLSWLTSVLSLAFVKHKEAVGLIPPLDLPLLVCDEKWMNDYMDQTTRMLDICNTLTGIFCNVEQSHLLLRHACHILLDVQKGPLSSEASGLEANKLSLLQEQLSRAHRSLCEWLGLQVAHEPLAQTLSPILQDMFKGLVTPHEKALVKGKGFLHALYGANAMMVFAFYILLLVVSQDNENLSMNLPIPSTVVWAAPMSHLLELAKDNAKQHSGSKLCLEDLRALEMHVKDLFELIEHSLEVKACPLQEEDARKLERAASELTLLLDNIGQGLEMLGTKLNEVFKAIVSSRSALLDKLGDLGMDAL